MRAWWWDNVARHAGELCGVCGRRYTDTPWHAPADLWRRVVQGRVALICPGCFGRWAEAEGLGRVVWVPTLGTDAWDVHDPLIEEIPMPAEPTMNLLRPEKKSLAESICDHIWGGGDDS